MSRAAAWYSIVVGIAMPGISMMLFAVGEVTEVPIDLGFHLVAEMITALTLIVAGVGLLARRRWGHPVYLLALGMLIYTLINSSGYYAQDGEVAFLVMFAVLGVFALVFAAWALRSAKVLQPR